MLAKFLSWAKALTMPILIVAILIGWYAGLADLVQVTAACSALLVFWLGPKGYKAIKAKKAKDESVD